MNTFRPLGRIHVWHIIARSNEEDMMFCIHIIHRTSHSFGKHEAYGHWGIPISFMPSAVLACIKAGGPLGALPMQGVSGRLKTWPHGPMARQFSCLARLLEPATHGDHCLENHGQLHQEESQIIQIVQITACSRHQEWKRMTKLCICQWTMSCTWWIWFLWRCQEGLDHAWIGASMIDVCWYFADSLQIIAAVHGCRSCTSTSKNF